MNHTNRKRLFAVLATIGMREEEDRHQLVYSFTKGRTRSTSDLSDYEAEQLINELESKKYQGANKMRRKIISMAYEMKWGAPYTEESRKEAVRSIDAWCMKSGYIKKPLNDFTYDELPKLVTQFQEVYKSYLKTN